MKKLASPFRVGLLVLASGAILFAGLTFVRKGGLSDRESIGVWAYFRDASGLGPKSAIQIAGINVGEITDIQLEGTRARVQMRIRQSIPLRQDASLTKRSESLVLGDYMLDLYPGSEAAPPMEEGGQIQRILDAPGMEAVFGSLSQITSDIQQVTSALRSVLGGEKGAGSLDSIVESLKNLSTSVDDTVRASAERLDAILRNFEGVSRDVRAFTHGQEGTVTTIVENVEFITRDVRDVLATVKKVIGSGEGELKESVASLKQTMNRLDATLENLEVVTRKVRDGEGPVGALLSDERLGQKISESVDDLSDFVSQLTQLKLEVDVRSDYLVNQEASKTTFGLRVIPKPDKYYLLEVVDDPLGTVETVLVQSDPPTPEQPAVQRQRITRNTYKLSAQFAKRFSFTTLRFGLIESTGGVGADLSVPLKLFWYSKWIEDALTLKVDAFNFTIEGVEALAVPRVRAALRVVPYQHLYLRAGVDDIFKDPIFDQASGRRLGGRDYFVGVGIYFTDEDLKAVLTAVPVPVP